MPGGDENCTKDVGGNSRGKDHPSMSITSHYSDGVHGGPLESGE